MGCAVVALIVGVAATGVMPVLTDDFPGIVVMVVDGRTFNKIITISQNRGT